MNFDETETTSTRIIKIKKSLKSIANKIIAYDKGKSIRSILHESDVILFFKIFDKKNEQESKRFDMAGMIKERKYKKRTDITDFIDSPPD